MFSDRSRSAPADEVPPLNDDVDPHEMPATEFLIPVLDRFVRHRYAPRLIRKTAGWPSRRSSGMRLFGVQITETGWQPCASPVGRVMAYSKSKCQALPPILEAEAAVLGDKLRAVIVADYEKTSAVSAEVAELLDDEAGGAIAAFKSLVHHPLTDRLNPVLVTGSTVLIDDDLRDSFFEQASAWLKQKEFDVELEFRQADGFQVLSGNGADCRRASMSN